MRLNSDTEQAYKALGVSDLDESMVWVVLRGYLKTR